MRRCTVISISHPKRDISSTISRSVFPSSIRNLRHEIAMVGILVHGDNHFVVHGPLPDRDAARALIRHWSIIQIGATTPPSLERWRISTKEFREDLEWAVNVPGDSEISPAVAQLLDELAARGITIHNSSVDYW